MKKRFFFAVLTVVFVACSEWFTPRVSHTEITVDRLSIPFVYRHEGNRFNGIMEIRDKNILLEEMYIKEGIQQGKHILYYPDQKTVKEERTYKDGVLHGPAFYYWPNGTLSQSHEFVEGRLGGKSLFYHRNGSLRLQMEFSPEGSKTGIWFEYDLNGNIIKETKYN